MVRAFYSKTPEKILESTFLCPTSSRVRCLNCRGCSLEVLLTANMRRSEHWGSNTFVLFWKVTLCCAAVKSESQAFFPPSLLFFLEALSIFLSAWPLLQQHRLRPHCVTWTMRLECNTKLLLVWMCWKKRENIYIYMVCVQLWCEGTGSQFRHRPVHVLSVYCQCITVDSDCLSSINL